jgi:hypothetical protein
MNSGSRKFWHKWPQWLKFLGFRCRNFQIQGEAFEIFAKKNKKICKKMLTAVICALGCLSLVVRAAVFLVSFVCNILLGENFYSRFAVRSRMAVACGSGSGMYEASSIGVCPFKFCMWWPKDC